MAADTTGADRHRGEAQVVRVVDRYFRALDDRRFDPDHFATIVAPDAVVVRPNGATTTGPADIATRYARSFDRFEATQHLLTGHDVELAGGTAEVRANLVAIHLWKDRPPELGLADRSFTAGSVVTVALARTADGWFVTRLQNRVVWKTGHLGDMPQTR